jgi:sensor histidine kinase YesM
LILTVNILDELSHPAQNGLVIFVSGFLFILGVYHFFLYFQHKDKSYLYYSLYTFLVFLYTFHRDPEFLLTRLSSPLLPTIKWLYDPIKWAYSVVYIYFAITFIELYKYNPKWDKILRKFAQYSLWLLVFLVVYALFIHENKILEIAYNFVFLPIVFVLSLMALYIFYKTGSPIKYYLIIGSGIYLLLAIFSHILTYTGHPFRVLFYAAITFEMLMFALGLGKKQKLILEEKNKWQKQIITEHEENLKLKDELTQKLDKKVKEKTAEVIELLKANEEEKREKIAIQYAKEMLRLKMMALQAQMNPHFLFNSLNSIKHFIINNEQKKSISYLTKFAKLIRSVLDYSDTSEISLKEEIDIMKLYLEIENLRFDHKIDYQFIIDPNINLSKIKIPPLIMQALIENAIWHGLAPKKENMHLIIRIKKQENNILIEIEDNGIGRKQAEKIKQTKSQMLKKKAMGINITEERLKVFSEQFKNKYRINFIDLTDDQGKPLGTKVELIIPIH